jgi:hypothetical protein
LYARWAYRFWIGYYWLFRDPMGTEYLVECETKDLRDELQRRVVKSVSLWCTEKGERIKQAPPQLALFLAVDRLCHQNHLCVPISRPEAIVWIIVESFQIGRVS